MGKVRADLRRPEVLRRIGELYNTGIGPKTIAKILKQEMDISVNQVTVKSIIDFNISRTPEILESDEKIRDMLKEDLHKSLLLYRKAIASLEKLHDKVETTLDKENLTAKDILSIKAILGEMLNYLYYNDRRVDRFLTTKEVTISTIKLTQMLVQSLEKLEKDGYITIHEYPEEYQKIRDKKMEEENEIEEA